MKNGTLVFTLIISLILLGFLSCGGGRPKLLPGKEPILFSKVDPAFSTTHIETIALLPLSNGVEFEEAAWVIYENLIAKFRSKYPHYKIIPPDEIMRQISVGNLSDDFNVFLGDYNNTGVANPDFLIKCRNVLNVDAVFFGKIIAYGSYIEEQKSFLGSLFGIGKMFRTKNRLGIKLSTFRGKDGRLIWDGTHIVKGTSKMGLSDLADALCEVIANYFGKRSY